MPQKKELYRVTVGQTNKVGVNYNVDSKTIVALSAKDAMNKYKKKADEFFQSVEMIAPIDIL